MKQSLSRPEKHSNSRQPRRSISRVLNDVHVSKNTDIGCGGFASLPCAKVSACNKSLNSSWTAGAGIGIDGSNMKRMASGRKAATTPQTTCREHSLRRRLTLSPKEVAAGVAKARATAGMTRASWRSVMYPVQIVRIGFNRRDPFP